MNKSHKPLFSSKKLDFRELAENSRACMSQRCFKSISTFHLLEIIKITANTRLRTQFIILVKIEWLLFGSVTVTSWLCQPIQIQIFLFWIYDSNLSNYSLNSETRKIKFASHLSNAINSYNVLLKNYFFMPLTEFFLWGESKFASSWIFPYLDSTETF